MTVRRYLRLAVMDRKVRKSGPQDHAMRIVELRNLFATLFFLCFAVTLPKVQAADELPMEDYFSSFPMCHGRSYSLQHLRANPGQKVVDVAISHFPGRQELLGLDSPFQSYPDTPRFVAVLDVWLKGQDEGWKTDVYCEPGDGRLKCAIECDGGYFYLQAVKNGRLLLTGGTDLTFGYCDADGRVLKRAPNDKAFLLDGLPRSHCKAD